MRILEISLACLLGLHAAGVQAEGDAAAGALKAQSCMGCHAISGYSNAYPNYRVPKIGGQHAAYLVQALQAYRNEGRPHKTMQAQAASLDDQDIQDIAAYFAAFGASGG